MEKNSAITLIFATQNENKVKEIQKIIPQHIQINSLKKIGCNDNIPEDHDNLKDNALQKARYIHDKYSVNCFADDTGLEIEALNGSPGVYSARYAGPERDNEANINLVLKQLQNTTQRAAQFRTVIALILEEKEYFFEGIVKGNITTQRRGTGGFGYDSIFQPEGLSTTFAEMSMKEKNSISHRSRAFKKLAVFLKNKT